LSLEEEMFAIDRLLAKETDHSIILLTKLQNAELLVRHLKRHLEVFAAVSIWGLLDNWKQEIRFLW